MIDSDNPIVAAILKDEIVNAENITQEDLEAVESWWKWSRSWLGTTSNTFEKFDRFRRVYGMLKN